MPSFTSCAKVKKLLKKGYMAWIVVVNNEELSDVDINKVPIVNEFLNVFPKELLVL